jgi:hypothetical protein
MPYPRPSPRERVLLYSLWAILILPVCIYFFWPRVSERKISDINVALAPELGTWFTTAKLVEERTQGFVVELTYAQKSLQSLSQVRAVQVGYDFGRDKEVLYRGSTEWRPSEMGQVAHRKIQALRLVLHNPHATAPRWIRLYFADSR